MTEHKMTAETATQFDTYSIANATAVALALSERGCDCLPYQDVFTYNRWKAQGMQVQKSTEVGHGIKLTTYIPVTKPDDNGEPVVTYRRPWHTTVFCRCQVKPIKES